MSNHYHKTEKPAETFQTHSIQTGIAPVGETPTERPITEKEKVEIWFIGPLLGLREDEGFICLLVCLPLIEVIVRYELGVPDEEECTFSDGSPALKWFAWFMRVPEAKAREVWDALRNGLIHRGMIKSATGYVLTGKNSDRPAELKGDTLHIYVWTLRDRVVDLLKKHHKKLWNDSGCPLPRITVVV